MNPDSFAENRSVVLDKIASAAKKAGRNPDTVKLLAVSKTWPADVVRAMADTGQAVFGENKVQEVEEKAPQLPGNLEWHFIGHLQKNKVRKVLSLCHVIHSIDSLALAERVDRIAADLGLHPQVYLEVNIGGEESKHGFLPDQLHNSFEALLNLPRLEIQGLMAIPPAAKSPEDARPSFVKLRELQANLSERHNVPMSELSMGMSGDYQVAIEEGSTIVRVGSALFGKRRVPMG